MEAINKGYVTGMLAVAFILGLTALLHDWYQDYKEGQGERWCEGCGYSFGPIENGICSECRSASRESNTL